MQKTVSFEITGVTSYLMHADNVEASDTLMTARKVPGKKGVAGDDRSPAWGWKTYLYHDGEHLCVPCQALMVAMRKAGANFKTKGKSTLKSESQSSIIFATDLLPIRTSGGKLVKVSDVDKIPKDMDFDEQKVHVESKLGFVLDVRRAAVGTSKHVRVRPKFLTGWSVRGECAIEDDRISVATFGELLTYAGNFCGIGDWRPSSPKAPGPHGRFTATVLKY
jgi:hypothetical protein